MGLPHANRGRSLEELVALVLAVYEEKGVAVVRRVPDPWKVVRRDGRAAVAFPVKKGLVDYLGVWRGIGVAFDCKETGGRFELGKVPQHQFDFLLAWESCGGLAGVLVWFWRAGLFAWVPAGECAVIERRSLSAGECAARGWVVPAGTGVPVDLEVAWRRVRPC